MKAGLSQNELGERMAYSGAAVSAVETCAKPATDEFIEAAERRSTPGGLFRWRPSTCGWSGIRRISRGSCNWSRKRSASPRIACSSSTACCRPRHTRTPC
ncbi:MULTISPECIES: hypothetical protein [unclassified Streptomyces]|uniref:hypothetical protein n=1 Tax=unclassified Streptomyces TaxID=2593676 RepID=UPI003D8DC6D2